MAFYLTSFFKKISCRAKLRSTWGTSVVELCNPRQQEGFGHRKVWIVGSFSSWSRILFSYQAKPRLSSSCSEVESHSSGARHERKSVFSRTELRRWICGSGMGRRRESDPAEVDGGGTVAEAGEEEDACEEEHADLTVEERLFEVEVHASRGRYEEAVEHCNFIISHVSICCSDCDGIWEL